MSGRECKEAAQHDGTHAGLQERGHALLDALVLCLFIALTALLTWPMVARWSSAVLGPPGDNLEYVWKMWWLKEAVVTRGISPFFNPDVFYPYGYPVALSETTLTHTLLGLPLTVLWGETAAYNAMMFASFVVSGYALYRLLRELGVGAYGGIVGGIAFAFCPYRLSHLGAGHLPLMGTGWIALLFMALERLIKRPSLGRGLLAGLFYALIALSSWYYAVMVVPFAVLYLLLRARPWKQRLWRGTLALGLCAGALLAGALIMPAALPILRLYGQGETVYDFSLRYVDQWSASPLDMVYPNAMHPWWGEAAIRGYYQNINENLVYLGLVPILLAVVGVWGQGRGHWTRLWAVLGIIAVILALGTTLHWAGKPVYVRVPAAVEHQFSRAMYVLTGRWALNKVDYGPLRREGAIVVPLPTLLLYLYTPLMTAMRVWARFAVLAMLALAVLAGCGAERIAMRLGTHRGRRVGVAMGLCALLLLDFAVVPYPFGYSEARGQPVDLWIRDQGEPGPVIQFPLEKTWYGWMLYAQRVHGRPIAYGYGTFMPTQYAQAVQTLESWPSEEAWDVLRQWGIRYILVGASSYGDEWPVIKSALDSMTSLDQVATLSDVPLYHGDRLLYLVPPTADVPSTELINGDRKAYLNDEIHVYRLR